VEPARNKNVETVAVLAESGGKAKMDQTPYQSRRIWCKALKKIDFFPLDVESFEA